MNRKTLLKKPNTMRKSILNIDKPKHLKLSTEKKKAWKVFSEYIRLRHGSMFSSGDVFCICYTCGAQKHWKEMQAGHGIGGRNNAVLFLEEVVKPQCVGCNVFGRGKYPIFTSRLIKELGMEEYDRILTLSQQTVKYTAMDYKAIAERYKQMLEHLKV